MSSSIPYAASEPDHDLPLQASDHTPAEKRLLRTNEVVYAVFALAIGVLLFATAF